MTDYDKLLNLINSDNIVIPPLNVDDISFSDPVVDIGATWNTKLTVSSLPTSEYIGSVDVFYTRPNLIELDSTKINNLISEIPFTPEMIINLINANRGTNFNVSDLELISIPIMDIGDVASVTLIMKSNSLTWIGNIDVSVLYGLSNNTDILHNLLNHVFPTDGYFLIP